MVNSHRHLLTLVTLACLFSNQASGISLFSDEIRQSSGQMGVVMDFLERYFTELEKYDVQSQKIRMYDDKVFFTDGNIGNLKQISDTMPLSISCREQHFFVKWTNNGQPFISIVFPAQFELIMGLNQDEAKKRFKSMVLDAIPVDYEQFIPEYESLSIINDSISSFQTNYFELESLNDASYYHKNDGEWEPLYDPIYPEYSAANLLRGQIDSVDYQMHIEQSVYGGEIISYDIKLRQWLNYCKEQDYQVYFAIEEVREDGMLAIVVAHCQELNYNHLASVLIPNDFVIKPQTVLKAKITPFIPTHNVKNLYQQQMTKHKKRKW